MSYIIKRGIPIKDIEFNVYKAMSGRYRYKMVCDNIFTFDTETTSDFLDEENHPFMFDYDNPEKAQKAVKHSLVYLWQFGIDDNRYIGRDISDFVDLLYELKQYCPFRKLCFIHNLSFDFNFLNNILKFDEVFARKPRHPMYAYVSRFGIEFRCSYVLMSLSLEKWAESLNLPVRKKVGLLDYRVMRTPLTPLSDDEYEYAIADLDVIYHGIFVLRKQYGHICDIPLTHTGKTRLACTERMKGEVNYNKKVTALMPQTLDEYITQAHAFMGGVVLCNWLYKDRIIEDIEPYDIASSYPWVLINNLYPVSRFYDAPKGKEHRYMYNKNFLYLIHFIAYDMDSNYNCHFVSSSKALKLKNVLRDNGRIVSCDVGEFIFTSVDYEMFLKCYSTCKIEIISFKFCRCDYLNDTFRKFVIELYKNKTILKNVKGQEELYQNSKQSINSLYGDYVTKIFSDLIVYNQHINVDSNWDRVVLDDVMFNKKLQSVNKKKFTNYKAFIQGVFVTAHARARIFDAVINGLDENIVYTDTDSLKVVNYHGDYFEKQNKVVLTRHEEIARDLGISVDELSPVDIKGNKHPIGIWEHEEHVKRFKSLGCKQYLCEYDDGSLFLTCAGISKLAVQCFKSLDDFNIHTTLTEKQLKECTDGKGHTAEKLTPYYANNYPDVVYPDGYISHYRYGVCLMPTTFDLSITPDDLFTMFTIVKEKLNESYYKERNRIQ